MDNTSNNMFVSIPRSQAVYCEDCDTISVMHRGLCSVCLSRSVMPMSYFIQAVAEEQVLSARAAHVSEPLPDLSVAAMSDAALVAA